MTGFPAFRISVLRSSEVTLLSKSRAAAKKPLSEHAWGNREHQSTDLGGVRDHGSLVQANQRSVRDGVAVWPHDSVGQWPTLRFFRDVALVHCELRDGTRTSGHDVRFPSYSLLTTRRPWSTSFG